MSAAGIDVASAGGAWDERLRPGTTNSFDLVRLALATMVLLEHSFFLIDNATVRDPLHRLSNGETNSGHLAVRMFFVLSGFLVTRSLLESRSVGHFVLKRLARIVPGFLVASAAGYLILGPLTSSNVAAYFAAQPWPAITLNVLALKQTGVSGALVGNPVPLVHGTLWTIQYELDCYLMLALLGMTGLFRPALRAVVMASVAAGLALAMVWPVRLPHIDHGALALLVSNPRQWPDLVPFFLAGSAFFLWRRHIPKSAALFAASIALVGISFAAGGVYWALLVAGAYAVLYAALSAGAEIRVLGRRTDMSYGVYLYGWPIQQALIFASAASIAPLPLFAASLIVSLGVAWASWVVVERPCLVLTRQARPHRTVGIGEAPAL